MRSGTTNSAVYTTLIDPEALAALIVASTGALCIIDCRADLGDPTAGARAFAERHLPGAQFLDLEQDLSGRKTGQDGRHPLPDRDALAGKLARMGVRRDTQVVCYDAQGGAFAARLWWLLRWLGHSAVAVLDGGFQMWEASGGLVEYSAPRQAAGGDFVAGPPLTTTIDTQAVLDNLTTHEYLVVDARAADRYRGENETIDPVGGHIPGARNRFFKDNLDGDGRFKSPLALRQEFDAVFASSVGSSSASSTPVTSTKTIMQCGSGVTACHNLLALEIAGLPGAALYPGSWSQWIVDPTRPVATGDQER